MSGVITVRDAKVIVPVHNTFVSGNVVWIRSIVPGPKCLSLVVREAMYWLRIKTVFSDRDLRDHIPFPRNSRIALLDDIAEAMRDAGQTKAAHLLRREIPEPQEVFVFPRWTYELEPVSIITEPHRLTRRCGLSFILFSCGRLLIEGKPFYLLIRLIV